MLTQPVPLSWTKRLSAGAVASGLSLDKLFERALIAPRFGDERDEISPLQLILFYAVLILETEDGTHAILRRRHSPETGPLGLRILLGSPNLGDGLTALIKFYQLSTSAVRWQLSTDGPQAFIAVRLEDDHDRGLLEEDIQLCYLYLAVTCFLGRPLPVSWITTRDAEHFNLGRNHYLMRSPVRLGSITGIAFPRALLAKTHGGIGMQEFGWRPLRQAFNLIEVDEEGEGPQPNHRDLRVSSLAEDLQMAPSSYRRMMAREGRGFRQMREQTLLDAALMRLRTASGSLDAVAAELGYSDARSFRRFVKRATGRTPYELRQDFALGVSPAKLHARLRTVISQIPL